MKEAEDIDKLLTGEGVLKLKNLCIENLDLKDNDEDEIKLLNDFVDTAKEVGFCKYLPIASNVNI